MGNCLSGSRSDTAALRELFNRPGVVDPPLNSAQIKEALGEVAKELEKKKHNAVIVAVGGAINTVLLGTRASTADVDFFGNGKGVSEELKVATEVVTKKLGLANGWLNNHTALFINANNIESLYNEAVKANIVLFKRAGLTVLAAPWRYSLVAKLEKAGKATAKHYDIEDAAGYLHQLIQGKKKKDPVKESELKAWAAEYRATISEANIDKVAAEYKKRYSQDGIIKG